MDIKLVIFPKDDMFHYSNYNEELQREFDAHLKHVSKEKCNLILEGIVAYRGEPMAFIDQQIEELCSVPKNLFNMLDNGSVVKSTCFIPRYHSRILSHQITNFLNGCERIVFIVASKLFIDQNNAHLLLYACGEDYEYEFLYEPNQN